MKTIPTSVIEAAQKAERTWGIAASISLAQWAVESAYGTHTPAGSNNPFGIKARLDKNKNPIDPFVLSRTREVAKDGHEYYTIAKFRKFKDLAEAFNYHAKLLATSKYYAPFKSLAKQPLLYVHKLTGVYATDPKYGDTLEAIIRYQNLTKYDGSVGQAAPVAVAVTTTAAVVTGAAVKAGAHLPSLDLHLALAGAVGLAVGAGLVFLWAAVLAYRQVKNEPLDIDEDEGSEDKEMFRAEAQPILDQIKVLQEKAAAYDSVQAQLVAANQQVQSLQSQLDAAHQDDVDTDNQLKLQLGIDAQNQAVEQPG